MPDKLSQIPYTPAQVLAHVRGQQGIRLRDQLGGVDWRHQRHLWRTGARPAAHALLCTLCHAVEGGRLERGRRGACKPHFDECTSPPKRPAPQCPPNVELGPSRLLNPTHCFFHSGPPILLFPSRGGHRGWGWSDGCTRRGGAAPHCICHSYPLHPFGSAGGSQAAGAGAAGVYSWGGQDAARPFPTCAAGAGEWRRCLAGRGFVCIVVGERVQTFSPLGTHRFLLFIPGLT